MPAANASRQREAHRHHPSPSFSPGNLQSIGTTAQHAQYGEAVRPAVGAWAMAGGGRA